MLREENQQPEGTVKGVREIHIDTAINYAASLTRAAPEQVTLPVWNNFFFKDHLAKYSKSKLLSIKLVKKIFSSWLEK